MSETMTMVSFYAKEHGEHSTDVLLENALLTEEKIKSIRSACDKLLSVGLGEELQIMMELAFDYGYAHGKDEISY